VIHIAHSLSPSLLLAFPVPTLSGFRTFWPPNRVPQGSPRSRVSNFYGQRLMSHFTLFQPAFKRPCATTFRLHLFSKRDSPIGWDRMRDLSPFFCLASAEVSMQSTRRFWINWACSYCPYGNCYLRKGGSATGLVLKRNSGCLKKDGGESSLPRIYGSAPHRLGLGEGRSSLSAWEEGSDGRRGLRDIPHTS